MKQLTYKTLPSTAKFIGSEESDGSIYEQVADLIDRAVDPVFIVHEGRRVFFDLGDPVEKDFDELRWLPGA